MLRHSIKFGLAAITLVVAMQVSGAQAAIASPAVAAAAATLAPDITSVRWVCGPLRCEWRPNHRGPLHPWATGWGAPRRVGGSGSAADPGSKSAAELALRHPHSVVTAADLEAAWAIGEAFPDQD